MAMFILLHMAKDLAKLIRGETPYLVAFHDNSNAESRHRKWSSPHPGECVLIAQGYKFFHHAGLMPQHTVLVPSEYQLADGGTRANPLF